MALVLCAGNAAVAAPASAPQSVALSELATLQHLVVDAPDSGRAPTARQSAIIEPLFNNTDPRFPEELEPNDTFATATPMTLSAGQAVYQANSFPGPDTDFFSFTATAGDRVFATTITVAGATGNSDTGLDLIAIDGTTVIEADEANGSFGASSGSIAGATIPTTGTYYLRVRIPGTIRPYRLYLQLRSGTPVAEVEPNDLAAQTLAGPGFVAGALSSATDLDFYAFNLNAGDTVVYNLDADPERDATDWNPSIGIGNFNNFILTIDDATLVAADPALALSEVFGYTVQTAGTYFFRVSSGASAPAGTFGTYVANFTVFPRPAASGTCTTYTSAAGTGVIPSPGIATATIVVPGNPRISDLNVRLVGTHASPPDLDVSLVAPGGNQVGLFTDLGNPVSPLIDFTLDDEAFSQPSPIFANQRVQPELNYRLAWFDGQDAGGTWTLNVRDDTAAATGEITSFSLEVCEPPAVAACPAGTAAQVVYTTDFESGDAGFTHSGTLDEWERGLPATVATTSIAAFSTCNSGTNCWKTDLDNTYDASSSMNLLSPSIDLTGFTAPVVVRWAQRYQMESASFDHYNVDLVPFGGPTGVRLFEWLDATMADTVGNPAVGYGEAAGWGQFVRTVNSAAGQNSQLRFHLDGDSSFQFAGAAIDDVSVTACRSLGSDLGITKTDGVTMAVPGGSVTYTITASNPVGGNPVVGATVTDTFPAGLTCNSTCAGTGGGTCTTPIAGNINDTVNLPAGASVTYTSMCAIAASATGSISNTATISSASDPNPANNSATDTDTLTPQANLGITKTDGVTAVSPGGSTTYTIVASNAGPSNAPGSTVTDTFPATLTCTNTCVGAGGGTCTAAGAGNINDTVNLPAGGSVTYTAMCTVSGAATGTIANTATVTPGAGVTDPTPGNNTATDTDTVNPAMADLSITKTDGRTSAAVGSTGSYTIVASNTAGPNSVTATVNDTVPQGFTVSGFTCTGTGGGICPATGGASQVIAAPVTLPVGSSVTFIVNGTYSVIGTVSNTASVTITPPATDPTPANNSATDTTTVGSPSNVSGTKTVTATVPPGGLFPATFTIVLTNNGTSAQLDNPGNEFDDVLPQGFTFTGASSTSGTTTYDSLTRTVAFNGAIPAGGSVTITINGSVNRFDVPGGTLSNQGTIRFDADGNGTNESTRLTDDPAVAGAANPTVLALGTGFVPVPTLDRLGLLLMILSLGLFGAALSRNRQ